MEMYDFKQHLRDGEEILYEGRPHAGKGSKNIGGELFIIGFCVLILAILILSIVYKIGDGANGVNGTAIVFFAVIGFFVAICLWGAIYKLFIKKRAVADDYFCITNKRVMKYQSKKDELVYGDINKYKLISCDNEKDGYGDITMSIDAHEQGIDEGDMASMIDLKNMLLHPDKEDMPQITFECVEKPRDLKKLIKEQQKKNAA